MNTYSYNFDSMMGIIAVFALILLAVSYVFITYPVYRMYKEANLKNPWFAFIPIFGPLKLYNLANISMWWYLGVVLICFIPIIGTLIVFAFSIYLYWKIAENFGLGTAGKILYILFGPFVMWYIVLTKKPFIGQINPKFTN